MATLTANNTLDMFNISSTFDLIELPPTTVTPTLIAGLTSEQKLQEYLGIFVIQDIQQGNFSTSSVTGFRQYFGPTTGSGIEYELSGANVSGDVLLTAILAGDLGIVLDAALGGSDVINGSNTELSSGFDDFLTGLGGNDTVYGNNGNDWVQGNQGNDDLYGGKGSDLLLGDEGNDELFAGDGLDQLQGGSGNDTLNCGAQADQAQAGGGNDLLNGGKGADTLTAGAGNDSIFAGTGNDTLLGDSGADYLKDGKGSDQMTGGTGLDTFSLSAGVDTVTDFSLDEGDLIELPIDRSAVDVSDSGANVLITMAASGSFEGGVTTLLNVSFTEFNNADPFV